MTAPKRRSVRNSRRGFAFLSGRWTRSALPSYWKKTPFPLGFSCRNLKQLLPTKARFETPDGAAIKGNGGEEPLARCAGLLPGLVSDSNKNRQQEEKDDFGTPEQETPQRQVLENNETLPMQSKIRGGKEAQIAANAVEAANRNRWLSEAISKQNLGNGYQADSSANDDAPESSGSDPSAQPTPGALETNNPISEFRPLWFEGSLFLIRRGMTIRTFAQGGLVNRRGPSRNPPPGSPAAFTERITPQTRDRVRRFVDSRLIPPSAFRRGMEIHVSDHGPGIPESERRRIFRSFHKSAEQAAETKPGIGLGLALSKRLARTMGGSLSCAKRKDGGSGAVFVLDLPGQADPES